MTWQNLLSGKQAFVRGASRELGRADAFRFTGASTDENVIVTDFLIESGEVRRDKRQRNSIIHLLKNKKGGLGG